MSKISKIITSNVSFRRMLVKKIEGSKKLFKNLVQIYFWTLKIVAPFFLLLVRWFGGGEAPNLGCMRLCVSLGFIGPVV